MDFDFELETIVEKIRQNKAKKIVLQLPDGLKPKAVHISKELEKLSGAAVYIWFRSNFGACDTPQHIREKGFDLIVNFGHSAS